MSSVAPQETEVISGTVTQIITKGNDKYVIEVTPQGSQFGKNLWTKDAGLVQQMAGSVGQAFDFVCRRSHYTRQDGQPGSSLWINQLAMFGSTPVAPTVQIPGTGAVQPVAGPVNTQGAPVQQTQGLPTLAPMEKEERIMREHAMSVVAQMLPHMPASERNAPGMVNVAEGLIRYYKLGPSALNGGNPGHDVIDEALDDLVQEGLLVEDTGGDDIPF